MGTSFFVEVEQIRNDPSLCAQRTSEIPFLPLSRDLRVASHSDRFEIASSPVLTARLDESHETGPSDIVL